MIVAGPLSITRQVRANRDLEAGEIVFYLPPVFVSERDRHSIQVGEGTHQAYTGDVDDFINHSCDPNLELVVEGHGEGEMYFRTLKPVGAGREVTWDYTTAETEFANPFLCACGATNCRGQIG